MNATDLKSLKNFLLLQKGQILNKTSEFIHEQSSERDFMADEAEIVSTDMSRNLSIHLHERDRSVLFEIEKALSKIEDGSYGHCESCGEEIGEKRLRARPFASLCIVCKEEQEDPRNLIN